jgi:CMP-N,N'-diacetyllegionaminic acid synthase
MKVLGVIPARGGSKGLPGKNIRPLNGKPLIAWTIDEAKASKMISKVIVSTDDKEIARVAEGYGAEVPFYRPAELASDTATSMDVIIHALDFFAAKGEHFDVVMMLEPTSPLRERADIDKALQMLASTEGAESVVGICKSEASHPDFLVTLTGEGFLRSKADFIVKRRQELEDVYFYEGTLYASYVDVLRKKRNFYHNNTLGYIVPRWKSFEVDDMLDMVIIEAVMKAREQKLF